MPLFAASATETASDDRGAAVDRKHLTGGNRRFIRGQIQRHVGYVRRLAEAK
jgi:hypothetical protein